MGVFVSLDAEMTPWHKNLCSKVFDNDSCQYIHAFHVRMENTKTSGLVQGRFHADVTRHTPQRSLRL